MSSAYSQQTRCWIVEDSWQQLSVVFNTDRVASVGETHINGQVFNVLMPEDMTPSNDIGRPMLPLFSQIIEVPQCEGFEIEVTGVRYDTLDAENLGMAYQLMPCQPSRSKSDTTTHQLVFDGKTYAADAFYSLPMAVVERVGVLRDRSLARLQFSPVSYNPVSGKIAICREAMVTVRYHKADAEASLRHFERYYTPAFSSAKTLNGLYPKLIVSAAPVRYLIVAHSMFRGYLDGFVRWKRQKGFLVDVAYTDEVGVGGDTNSIRAYIMSQYTNATTALPAPTYLLLVGDNEQIPAFHSAITDKNHITDLYYATWTDGDIIPDCYYGRFSAQNVEQLIPQIQKTLMYEQYTFSDPSFLDRAVMVAGVDGGTQGDNGYKYGDPAMDYAIVNYINGAHGFSQVQYFKNDVSIVPAGAINVTVAGNASSMSATVRGYYNQGASIINYSAHGSPESWGTPELNVDQVAQMTNTQKFGLMIGNCCQTNSFQIANCLGEALLRKGNYAGAVGYIGGSNNTYWGEDFTWAVGVRNDVGPTMSMEYRPARLGAYDRVMHTHGEDYGQWAMTQGAIVHYGNMAVENSTSAAKTYYWEIYHLMGDPSVMTYFTQADTMAVAVSHTIVCGTPTLSVSAVPYAYVALVDTASDQLIASAFANISGNVVLSLPADLAAGGYRLAASAQQYQTAFVDITASQPQGPYAMVSAVDHDPLNAGDTVALSLHVENYGNATAYQIVAHLACDNPMLALLVDSVVIDSLTAGGVADIMVNAYVAAEAPDYSLADLHVGTTWAGCIDESDYMAILHLVAPKIMVAFANPVIGILAGNTVTTPINIRNAGHAALLNGMLSFTSPTSLLTATLTTGGSVTLNPDADTTVMLTLHADAQLPSYITLPVSYQIGLVTDVLPVYIGSDYVESFEGGSTHVPGLTTYGNNPWIIIDSQAYEGTYCMRSAFDLADYGASEMKISINVAAADSISFYYRVSSEANYDIFSFKIDNVTMLEASGDREWEYAQYYLSAGQHILKFRYEKDVSWGRGSDCVWVDKILLPHLTQDAVFRNDTVCLGSEYAPFGDTINTQSPCCGSISGTQDGVLTIVEYVVMPAAHTVDSITAYGSYWWNGLEYVLSGEYRQVLTTSYGCDSIVDIILTVLEGVNGISSPSDMCYSVHPNPTTGEVCLSERVSDLQVYDLQGRLVIRMKDVQRFDIGHLPQGVYTIRISTDQGNAVLRVIRQ